MGKMKGYDEVEVYAELSKAHPKSTIQVRNRSIIDQSDLEVCCIQHKCGETWRHPEDAIKQRERLKQERIAAREQRVEPVSEVRQEIENVTDENLQAAESDSEQSFEEENEFEMTM